MCFVWGKQEIRILDNVINYEVYFKGVFFVKYIHTIYTYNNKIDETFSLFKFLQNILISLKIIYF